MAKRPASIPARPFNFPQTPYDPRFGRMPLSPYDINLVREFVVVSEDYEFIKCTTECGTYVNVAKPFTLRSVEPDEGETESDTVTINGIDYVYTSENERTASKAGAYDENQIITPTYYEDEVIVAIRVHTGIVCHHERNNSAVVWVDMNTAGRQWAVKIVEIT